MGDRPRFSRGSGLLKTVVCPLFSIPDGSVKAILEKLLLKRLEQPRTPGAELRGDLRDCYKIKLLGRFGAADCWKPWSVPYFPVVCPLFCVGVLFKVGN